MVLRQPMFMHSGIRESHDQGPAGPVAAERRKMGDPMDDLRPGQADPPRRRVFEDLLCGVFGAMTGVWVFQDFSLSHGRGLLVGAGIAAMLGGLVLVRLVRVFREPGSRRGDQEEASLPTVHPAR